ncbi:MAG TPA: hypothetical protein VLT83_05395 [Opitutaceae bacterium]|nr:hypothetical protein [Opitutaceae bacterium]
MATGSREVAPGPLLLQTPQFPVDYEDIALAHLHAVGLLRQTLSLDWTVVSPPASIAPRGRTGRFGVGGDQLPVNAAGERRIFGEDFAVAALGEVEKPRHLRRWLTVAY